MASSRRIYRATETIGGFWMIQSRPWWWPFWRTNHFVTFTSAKHAGEYAAELNRAAAHPQNMPAGGDHGR